jgi:GT2 family glycosyltransferase
MWIVWMSLFVLIPTFREATHVRALIADLEAQTLTGFVVFIVNSNPGDETSNFLAAYDGPLRLTEISGRPDLFWTGALALGLSQVAPRATKDDYCLFLNCDVRISPDFISSYLALSAQYPNAWFCPATVSGNRYVTSGVKMRSWLLSLTDHKFTGAYSKSTHLSLAPVDMLAGRGLLFPLQTAKDIGGLNAAALPHYGGDYEFSARAKRNGAELYVTTLPVISLDTKNTGKKASAAGGFLQRFSYLHNMRSPLNLGMRSQLVLKTYPMYAIPTGLLTVFLKAFIEVIFGPIAHRTLGRKHIYDEGTPLAS